MGREVQAGRAERVAAQAGDRDRPDPPHPARHLPELQHLRAGSSTSRATRFELRYAFATEYNEIPWNPVLYLEWHPRKQAQDRAEIRLLMGGDLPAAGLWAANVFAEGNVDYFNASYAEGFDGEFGAIRRGQLPGRGRLAAARAEVQGGVDQHGSPRFYAVGARRAERPPHLPAGGSEAHRHRALRALPRGPALPAVRHRRLAVLRRCAAAAPGPWKLRGGRMPIPTPDEKRPRPPSAMSTRRTRWTRPPRSRSPRATHRAGRPRFRGRRPAGPARPSLAKSDPRRRHGR